MPQRRYRKRKVSESDEGEEVQGDGGGGCSGQEEGDKETKEDMV